MVFILFFLILGKFPFAAQPPPEFPKREIQSLETDIEFSNSGYLYYVILRIAVASSRSCRKKESLAGNGKMLMLNAHIY